MIIYEVSDTAISLDDYLQSTPRWSDINQQNSGLILITQPGISLLPNSPAITLYMVEVNYTQAIQSASRLFSPAPHLTACRGGFIIGGYENHKRQTLLQVVAVGLEFLLDGEGLEALPLRLSSRSLFTTCLLTLTKLNKILVVLPLIP